MARDFETDPEYQEQLDWVDPFVHDQFEPHDLLIDNPCDKSDERAIAVRGCRSARRLRG